MPDEIVVIWYQNLETSPHPPQCFCHRPARWEKGTDQFRNALCERHWILWRKRFMANPGPCVLRHAPAV